MKRIFQYSLQACLAMMFLALTSCNDELLPDEANQTGDGFRLTVTQAAPSSRLALDQNGLTTKWEPGDQLVLVDKTRAKAPVYLTCDLAEPADEATFSSESGVPAGDYWVIYNYNEHLAYTHQTFASVDEINTNDKLVLYGSLNVASNTSSATVEMKHLYAKINVVLKNLPTYTGIDNNGWQIGMYSTKKGMPLYRMFTQSGLVDAEYGMDPNNLNYNYTSTYFQSNKKEHNVRLGKYVILYDSNEEYDSNTGNYNYTYTPNNLTQLQALSALVLPEDLSDEEVFFYVITNNEYGMSSRSECYEIKKPVGVANIQAGVNYTVELDLSTATHTTLTAAYNNTTYSYGACDVSTPAEWRHVVYSKGSIYHINLPANIDFANEYFFPITGGTIEGNGTKMSNITLERPNEDNVGLSLYNLTVSNLTLENVTMTGKNKVGAFGATNVYATDCQLVGTSAIIGENYVGGIVGLNDVLSQNLSKVTVGEDCTVNGVNYVGGIVGALQEQNYYGGWGNINSSQKPLNTCISSASVTATGDYVGGIFGKIGGNIYGNSSSSDFTFEMEDNTYTLLKCQNKGSVTGRHYVGGIGGDFACYGYYSGTSSSGTTLLDRVVLSQSCSDGTVTGENYVGGILGSTWASVNTCYSINTITGTEDVGGIVGVMQPSGYGSRIANCYSLADLTVNTNARAGGIVGNGGGGAMGVTVVNSYFAGTNPTTSGIIGCSGGYCTVNQCLTTLASLGVNLDTSSTAHPFATSYDPYTGQPTGYMYCPDNISSDSQAGVTSILNNINVINSENAYSTNVWANYPYDCVKFASFSAETDSPDFGSSGM